MGPDVIWSQRQGGTVVCGRLRVLSGLAQRSPQLAVEPEVVVLTAARLAQQVNAPIRSPRTPQQTSQKRQLMGRWRRRDGEGLVGELAEFLRGAPGRQLAEAVPPARPRICRSGDF